MSFFPRECTFLGIFFPRGEKKTISRKDTRKIEVSLDKTCLYGRCFDVETYLYAKEICKWRAKSVSTSYCVVMCCNKKERFLYVRNRDQYIDAKNRAISPKETCLHEWDFGVETYLYIKIYLHEGSEESLHRQFRGHVLRLNREISLCTEKRPMYIYGGKTCVSVAKRHSTSCLVVMRSTLLGIDCAPRITRTYAERDT